MNFPFGEPLHSLRERVAADSLRVHIAETLGVSNVLARLSSRERLSVGAAALALGVIVGYVFVIDPLWEMHARLRARIATKEREVREVAELGRTYEIVCATRLMGYARCKAALRRAARRNSAALSPFAVLEGLATNDLWA